MRESFLIERIKETLTIEEVIEKYTDIDLSRARPGRTINIRCPFHEDRSPSFTIWIETNRWKCQAGCGHGDQIDLVAMTQGIELKEAIKVLAADLGLDEPLNEERSTELKKKAKAKKQDQELVESYKTQFKEIFQKALTLERTIEDKLSNIRTVEDLGKVGELYHIRDYLGYLLDCMVEYKTVKEQMEAFKQLRGCLKKWGVI